MIRTKESSINGVGRVKLRLAVMILIALLAIPAIWWFAGGVMLVATSGSSRLIGDLKVAYGDGVAQFGELPAGATMTKVLGQIGEGATFYVDLEQGGERLEYHAEVYFVELGFFRTKVFVEVGNDRRVTFRSGRFVTEAIASSK